MEVAGIPILTFVAFILTIVSLVVDLIGFAAPYWYYVEIRGITGYGGIWKYCISSTSTTTCLDYVDLPNLETWFKAVQALEVLGFLCLIAALVVVILKLFVLKDKPILKRVILGCLGAAAAFILFGVGVYRVNALTSYTDNLHFAFAFVNIGALLAIIAAILFGVDKELD